MGAILLWLAETIGGEVLKSLVERWMGKPKAAPDPATVAQASRAQATAAQAKQDAQAQADRAKVDEQVMDAGAKAARDDMKSHWNKP